MKIGFKTLLGFCSLILMVFLLSGQDREELEKERKKLLTDIDFTRKLLDKTSEDKKLSIDQLETLKRQIGLREKMINNIAEDIDVLSSGIDETNDIISALERDLEELKSSYAKMLYSIYKNRSSINELVFLFSSKSFNDALKRARYIQQYSQFRKRQAELIEETKLALTNKTSEQQKKRSRKEKLLEEEQEQRNQLESERRQKDKMIATLQQQEKKLRKEIEQKQEDAEKLNDKIQQIIEREIAAAKKEATEAEKKGNVLALAPEYAKLSADFSANQGKLPWPVDRGIISSTFGEHQHPVLKYVKTVNNGVDIKTYDNAKVRAVFAGTVISVVYNPSFQRAIIVRHGDYFTVYSNLREVYVKSGDDVSIKQVIGAVFTDDREGKSDVHFEVWKGTQKLNPALWIYSQNP